MTTVTAFLLLLLAAACSAGIISGPLNAASYPGPAVELNCTAAVGDRVMWKEYITSPTGSLISDGSTLVPSHPNYADYRLTVDESAGIYNLKITPTAFEDGGLYECTDDTTLSKYAEVVMLKTKANCTSTLPSNGIVNEGVYYSIDCVQYFQASPGVTPYMSWTGPGDFNQYDSPQNGSEFSGITFDVQKSMDAGKFTLKVNFTTDDFGGSTGMASNAPTWSDTWTSQVLYVQWGPQNVYYTPNQLEYEIDTTITCYANANPLPTYKWTDLNTLIEYNSQTITLTEAMVGPLNLRCQIVNAVSTANIMVNATVKPRTTTPPPTTTTTTTPVPPVSNCLDLTGRWEFDRAADSKAVLCLYVDGAQNGYVSGLLWNDTKTETYYMEIMGRTRNNIYDETSFIGIWPLDVGVSAFAAECHRCYGVESLLVNPLSRSSLDNEFCGHGGEVLYGPQYNFHRVPPSYPCAGGTTWKELRAISRQAAAMRAERLKREAERDQ